MTNKSHNKYILLLIGNTLNAYAVISILKPNGMMTGGVTGLSRLFERIIKIGFETNMVLEQYLFSIIYYILAILVLVFAYILLGKEDALKIIFLSLTYPLLLFLFTFLELPAMVLNVTSNTGDKYTDLLIPTLAYGIISGFGTGLILRSGFTSGGSDTIAKIIYRKLLPFISFGQVLLLVDGIIIFSAIFVFDFRIIAYAVITKYVNMRAVDIIILGIGSKRVKMEIISVKYKEIIPFIQNSIHRGVTLVDSEGAFSKVKIKQIITICSPRESLHIKNFIAKIDENAFVYVMPSSTVWGKGFKNIAHDELS